MARLLRLVSVLKGANSAGGGALPDIVAESVFTMDNVQSVSVVATRDHADQNVIKALALLLSGVGGVASPIATLSSMEDPAALGLFQSYVKDVLGKICSTDDVVVIDVKSF
ncbi:MAG: hypothetical protein EOP84_07230 [Verrucomicrobiaceae bacterium]|nr:MAG: hypothetical protein EOP84_07230 [Verrucomicrobiaceae bacterium]